MGSPPPFFTQYFFRSVAAAGTGTAVAAAALGPFQRRPLDQQQRLPPAFRTPEGQLARLLLERMRTRSTFKHTHLAHYLFTSPKPS